MLMKEKKKLGQVVRAAHARVHVCVHVWAHMCACVMENSLAPSEKEVCKYFERKENMITLKILSSVLI